MNSNKRTINATATMKSNRLQKQATIKSDKFTNTSKDLYECKKCKERELSFANFNDLQNNTDILINYVKAINYINSCHNVINEIQRKINTNKTNECNCEIHMPDVPNFLNLFTTLLSCNKINCESKDMSVNTIDSMHEEQNVHSVKQTFKKQHHPEQEQVQSMQCNENMPNNIEEMFAKEMCEIAKKKLMEHCTIKSGEPVALLMDEVCNLADIPSQQSVREDSRKNKLKKSARNNAMYEYDDTDTECAEASVKHYELGMAYDYNFEEDGKTYRSKIPINLVKNQKENEIMTQHNVMSKLESLQTQFNQREVTKLSEDDNSAESSPRTVYPNRSAHKMNPNVTENRKSSAPIVTKKEQNWSTKNAIRLQLRQNKLQNVTAFNRQKPSIVGKEYECNRTEFGSQIKSNSYTHDNTPLKLNLNRDVKSQHYFTCGAQREAQINQQFNTVQRENSILEKGNGRSINFKQRDNQNNKFLKSNDNHRQEDNDRNQSTKRMLIETSKMPILYKIENKPNDFFTETHRNKMKSNDDNESKQQTYSCNVINNDKEEHGEQFYTDSDIDEDHFQNAIEIQCSNNTNYN